MIPADSGENVQWLANGLRMGGIRWGNPGGRPLLALHGWLDNAASFSRLAPLLQGCDVVALDLTGHGLSDRRSLDATYQIWDDLPQILEVVDQLGWQRFALLGHSRGAIIAGLFAAALGERVTHLVQLDASFPEPLPEQDFPRQLRRFLLERRRLLSRQHRSFATPDEAVAARAGRGLPEGAAQLLARRNLQPLAGAWNWRTDPRLSGASAVKLSEGQIDAMLASLCMPVLLVLAEGGLARADGVRQRVCRQVSDITVETVAGGHHFHMEDGAADLARSILAFLAKDGGGQH